MPAPNLLAVSMGDLRRDFLKLAHRGDEEKVGKVNLRQVLQAVLVGTRSALTFEALDQDSRTN